MIDTAAQRRRQWVGLWIQAIERSFCKLILGEPLQISGNRLLIRKRKGLLRRTLRGLQSGAEEEFQWERC
jgi:hypothetical protein